MVCTSRHLNSNCCCTSLVVHASDSNRSATQTYSCNTCVTGFNSDLTITSTSNDKCRTLCSAIQRNTGFAQTQSTSRFTDCPVDTLSGGSSIRPHIIILWSKGCRICASIGLSGNAQSHFRTVIVTPRRSLRRTSVSQRTTLTWNIRNRQTIRNSTYYITCVCIYCATISVCTVREHGKIISCAVFQTRNCQASRLIRILSCRIQHQSTITLTGRLAAFLVDNLRTAPSNSSNAVLSCVIRISPFQRNFTITSSRHAHVRNICRSNSNRSDFNQIFLQICVNILRSISKELIVISNAICQPTIAEISVLISVSCLTVNNDSTISAANRCRASLTN